MVKDKVVACGEIWSAVDASAVPVSEEEKLRGGDGKIAACLFVETLRLADAERLSVALAGKFPKATAGIYRLLCEIEKA
jgi:hypothetical protein